MFRHRNAWGDYEWVGVAGRYRTNMEGHVPIERNGARTTPKKDLRNACVLLQNISSNGTYFVAFSTSTCRLPR